VGTIATYGFIVTYLIVSIAAPVYLLRRKELTAPAVLSAVLAIGFLGAALAGNLYPVPPAPYNWLPYLFVGYLVLGWIWFVIAKQRSSKVVGDIHSDLGAIRNRFAAET